MATPCQTTGHLIGVGGGCVYCDFHLPTADKTTYPSGAHKSNQTGRGHYHSLDPDAIHRIALRCEYGDTTHGRWNWRKGIPLSNLVGSILRHAFQYLAGDASEDHLAAIAVNAMMAMGTEERMKRGELPRELDDR